MNKLRQLIQESISEYIKAIDEAGHRAGMEARKSATEEAIAKRKTMVTFEGLDEDMRQMVDERKVKEVNSEIKALEKSLVKLQKQFDKLNSKANKGEKIEDTEENKEIVDEAMIDEGETAEKLFQMFKDENLLNDRREYDAEDFMSSYPELSKDEAEKLENMLQNPDNLSESDDINIYEILHMQKMAGIISESEYVAKINEVKKKKASAGMTKKEKSTLAKKAHAGKDIGKKGPGFEKVAKAAGGGEKGEKIAAAAMWKGEAKKAKSLKEQVKALFENEGNEGTINFGSFKNVEWYSRENNKIFLVVTESDNFRKIENSMTLNPNADTYTDKERSFLNNKVDELANNMSNYLVSIGVENEVFDSPIGYGQEIDNLVIEINKDDLNKIK